MEENMYTIVYKDKAGRSRQIAGYPGTTATEALTMALEEVPYLHANPNSIERVIEEDRTTN